MSESESVCPTPHKIKYPSQKAAIQSAKVVNTYSVNPSGPYKCKCGHWHLGRIHSLVKLRKSKKYQTAWWEE